MVSDAKSYNSFYTRKVFVGISYLLVIYICQRKAIILSTSATKGCSLFFHNICCMSLLHIFYDNHHFVFRKKELFKQVWMDSVLVNVAVNLWYVKYNNTRIHYHLFCIINLRMKYYFQHKNLHIKLFCVSHQLEFRVHQTVTMP